MKEIFFTLSSPDKVLVGKVYNIPESKTFQEIQDRLSVNETEVQVSLMENGTFEEVDLEIDWNTIDEEATSINEDMSAISDVLDQAMEKGLETEVIYWSLKNMKENPSLSITEAINLGLSEWVK